MKKSLYAIISISNMICKLKKSQELAIVPRKNSNKPWLVNR